MVALGVNGSAYYITCNRLIAKDNINSFNTDGRIYFTSSDNQIWSIGCNVNKDWSLRNETLSIDSITADYNTGAVSLYGGGGTVSALSNLEDVTLTGSTNNQVLKYNGSIWVNNFVNLTELADTNITSLNNGNILRYNSTSTKWETDTFNINDLDNVNITSVANNEILKYNSTSGKWENSNRIDTLDELGDVTLTSVTTGDLLRYNGSNFVNTKIALDNDFTNVNFTSLTNGDLIKYDGSDFINFAPTYLDGAGIPDNYLIKVVSGVTTRTTFIETSTLDVGTSLNTYIPTTSGLSLLGGSIETEFFDTTKRRMHLTSGGIAATSGITVTTDGRVGIGIVEPDEELEIDGSIQIDSANVARLKFKKTGQNSHALSEIDGEQDGTNGGDLQFYTKIDGGSVTEKLRINNVGAIGIGGANYGTAGQVLTSDGSGNAVSWEDQTDTTYTAGTGVSISPANVISIGQSVGTGDSPSFTQMSLGNTGTNHGILNLQDITNIGTEDVAQIQGILEGTNGGQLQFYTKVDSGGVLTERLRISNDGNVRFFNALTTNGILGTASNVAIDFNQSRGGFGSIYFDTGRAGNNFEFYVNEINSYFNGNPEGLYLNFNGGGGVFYGSPPTQLSDDRIKFNETNITNGLEVVRKLSPERYTKRLPTETVGTVEAGFIAQEVLSIPDLEFAVKQSNKEITPGDPNTNYYTVTYDSIFTYAVAGLKELDTIVQQQQTVIQNLVTRIEALESK